MESFLLETLPAALRGSPILALGLSFVGGLLSSLSPCVLALIPLVAGYIGGFADGKRSALSLSSLFLLGLSLTFTLMGLAVVALGRFFGQFGSYWYLLMAAVAFAMGLNLLGVIRFNIPGLKTLPRLGNGWPGAFAGGMFFGMVTSTCSTPVLAGLLAYISTQPNYLFGALALFLFGLGHGLPLLLVGAFAGALKGIKSLQPYGEYFRWASGLLVIAAGAYLLTLGL